MRQRGNLTVWLTDEAIDGWRAEPRTTPGGQPWYSSLAILTTFTLRAVFRLALRQTEGLIGSVIGLLGLDLAVPDHSTLCHRAETLEVPRPRPYRDGEPLHLRWSPFFGQAVKLGPAYEKDGPDDGQAEAVFG